PQVRQRDEAGVALSLDDDAALAFLRRLRRDDLRNRPGGLREGAELAVEESERGVDVEVAGEDRLAVVGMEERAVVLAQLLGADALDVRAIAERVPVIGMRLDGGGDERLAQRSRRVVLADLVLVANDRHLGLALAVEDEGTLHAVGLDAHREIELVARQ